MVAQLCSDFENNYVEVNKRLDKMGHNIGMRLIEDFFAKSGVQRCANFRETAETISKVGNPFFVHHSSNFMIYSFVVHHLLSTKLRLQTDRVQDVS